MGMDIHVHVVNKNGEYIKKNLFDGRNRMWFQKIDHEEDEYDYVKWIYDYEAEFVPVEVKKVFRSDEYSGYFGFKAVKVADLLNWYDRYRPDVDAGWIRRYDKWRWENKATAPDEIYHYFDESMNVNDWVWVENLPKEDECIKVIIDQIDNNQVNPNDYVIMYFDW